MRSEDSWDLMSIAHGKRACGGLVIATALAIAQAPESSAPPVTPAGADSQNAATGDGGASEPPGESGDFIITAESNLVIVPLHVYKKKRSVNGLGPEAFELLEDGVAQDIAFVEGPHDDPERGRTVPTEIIFLIDFSYSVMQPGLLDFVTIRSALLDQLRDDVFISVYGFAGTLKRFTGPTRDLAKLQRAVDNVYAAEAGGSKVYEAIIQTARDVTSRGGNMSRMMIVFSDGMSTTKLDPNIAVQAANVMGIPIYPVILGHDRLVKRAQGAREFRGQRHPNPRPGNNRNNNIGPLPPQRRNPNRAGSNLRAQENRMRVFADLGYQTGGRSFDPMVINNQVIRQILGSLSKLAQTEYVVGYYPRSTDEERTGHQVEVRLTDSQIGTLYGGRRLIIH